LHKKSIYFRIRDEAGWHSCKALDIYSWMTA